MLSNFAGLAADHSVSLCKWQSSSLANVHHEFATRALKATLRGLNHGSWEVRNVAAFAFSSLCHRTVGHFNPRQNSLFLFEYQQEGSLLRVAFMTSERSAMMAKSDANLSSTEFVNRFPSLCRTLEKELEDQVPRTTGQPGNTLHPILTLFARLRRPREGRPPPSTFAESMERLLWHHSARTR